MKKEQAKAYIEILDNLKRDLAEEGEVDIKRIRANIEGYASGAYTKEGDELIVIPSSALDEIFGIKNGRCMYCKSYARCSIDKQLFYNNIKHKCMEFEEANQ